MTTDGNGTQSRNGRHRWWQIWKRDQDVELDLAAYRRLAVQLHHGLPRAEQVSRSVLIATPNESRFWAAVCVTLASCMAEELRRPVLLVEADGSDEVSEMLGSASSPGLADLLTSPARPLRELALQTSQQNVWFLPRGTAEGSFFPGSPEDAQDLLVRAAEEWDFIVIAGGPVLRNAFALAMAPYVGRVLMLVIEGRTPIEDIDAAQNALEQCKAQNVSLVLTI